MRAIANPTPALSGSDSPERTIVQRPGEILRDAQIKLELPSHANAPVAPPNHAYANQSLFPT